MKNFEIKKILLNHYLLMLTPAIVLIALLYLLKYFEINFYGNFAGKVVSVLALTFAGLFAVGLPVFYRSLFVNKVKNLKDVPIADFINYEKTTIMIALVTPYVLAFSLILNLKETYISFLSFFSIYAAYYYYPSGRKIKFEKKIFRIKEEDDDEK